MTIPEDLRYTADHEWVRRDGDRIVVGITDFAQSSMGDVVHVDRPSVGTEVAAGDLLAEIESTKSVSEIYAPVAGTVIETNEAIDADPAIVNGEPYGGGWIVVLSPTDGEEYDRLLAPDAYARLVEEAGDS